MKRRIRPIAHARDEPVLEWIYITIFDMARIISLSRIRCSQNPRCRMPRSLRATRTALTCSTCFRGSRLQSCGLRTTLTLEHCHFTFTCITSK
jgi:hypothetical protein